MKPHTNTQGAQVGPRGYVLCLVCHEEATDISRETSIEYAYHVHHRPNGLGGRHHEHSDENKDRSTVQ